VVRYGEGDGLVIAVVHLALGRRARGQQLKYLAQQLQGQSRLVVMGDLNTTASSPQLLEFRETLGLVAPTEGLASYPSWQPQRAIDHILVSHSLKAHDAAVSETTFSDHCPVSLTLELPEDFALTEATRPVLSVQPRRR
jgi:endonuclease/exonuclease/phosphatase family metal-dependent hydrolase